MEIAVEPPHAPGVDELLRLGGEFALSLYPPESSFLLSVDELAEPHVRVHVARTTNGDALGMAAIVIGDAAEFGGQPGDAELKRMFVHPDARGLGIAIALLQAVETDARRHGAERVVLETGPLSTAAIGLYSRAGYVGIPLYGKYIGESYSVCYAKSLR